MTRATGGSRRGATSREELEDVLRDLQKDLRKKVVGRARPAVATGLAVAAVAILGAYALGRSSGRKARTEGD